MLMMAVLGSCGSAGVNGTGGKDGVGTEALSWVTAVGISVADEDGGAAESAE